jgi:hypothetical protein
VPLSDLAAGADRGFDLGHDDPSDKNDDEHHGRGNSNSPAPDASCPAADDSGSGHTR